MTWFYRFRWGIWAILAVVAVLLVVGLVVPGTIRSVLSPLTGSSVHANQGSGDQLGGTPAPNFSLTDQFGHTHKLSDFRGKIVVLAFIDSRCTDTCPLTAETLRQATAQLGSRAGQVQLLAVNANPIATGVSDALKWSNEHDMTNRWLFLTGSASTLKPLWAAYHVQSEIQLNGDVEHTPATYLIDRQGREQWLDLTDSTKSDVPDETTTITQQLSDLLGG